MSRLDELLQQYCPNGVEYVPLNAIAEYASERIDAEEVDQHNYVGVDNLLQNKMGKTESSYVPTEGRLIKYKEGDVLIGNIRPYLKKIWLAEYDGGTNGDVLVIHITKDGMLPKYLYYCLSSEDFFHYDVQHSKGSKMPRGDKSSVMAYEMPVPPLAVQEEIVRVLDKFTELEAELEAELLLRKQQYEHYRDELFVFDDTVAYIPLVELAEIGTGSRNTQDAVENGEYDFYVRSPYPLKHNQYDYDDESIITAGDGVGVGKVFHLTNGKYALHQRAYRIHPKNINCLSVKYLYYFFTANFYDYITGAKYKGSVASIRLPMLQNFMVPVPSMHEQKRIVGILDRFDALCTDITAGLPAEITARQKQYEYYRDKLLSFEVTT